MHADALYHRMLEQEAAIEAAREEGREIPKFGPLVTEPKAKGETGAEDDFDVSRLSPEAQKKWKEQLEKVPEEERRAEERAMKGEMRAKAELASRIQGLWKEQEQERQSRKAEGKDTIIDKVSGLFGGR